MEALFGFERLLLYWRRVIDAEREQIRGVVSALLVGCRNSTKTRQEAGRLSKMLLASCVAFRELDPPTQNKLVDAMWSKNYQTGDMVHQDLPSTRHDLLFAVGSGVFHQLLPEQERPEQVWDGSGVFGENTILPRMQASRIDGNIRCVQAGRLWLVSRSAVESICSAERNQKAVAVAVNDYRLPWGQPKEATNCFVLAAGDNRSGQLALGRTQSLDPEPPQQILGELRRCKALDQSQISNCVCGYHSTYFVTMVGDITACGRNSIGQLALGHYQSTDRPRRIEALGELALMDEGSQVVCSGSVVYVWNNKVGMIAAWGDNSYGQLGLGELIKPNHTTGSYPAAFVPTPIPSLCGKVITNVVCGANFAYFFVGPHDVYGVGHNASMQLALGHKRDIHLPERIPALCEKGIVGAAAGFNFAWFLTSADEVLAVGDNHFGQIGRGEFSRTCGFPQRVLGLQQQGVCHVACGQYFAYALTDSGDVYSTGRNISGQLALGNFEHQATPQRVKALSRLGVLDIQCSAETAYAHTINGSLFLVGYAFGLARDGAENCPLPIRLDLSKFFKQGPSARFDVCTSPSSDFFFILVNKNCEYRRQFGKRGLH